MSSKRWETPTETLTRALQALICEPNVHQVKLRSKPKPGAATLRRAPKMLSRGQMKTRQQAKEQETVIHERLRRANLPIPPYEFQNFIGKGSYGRVYVANHLVNDGYGRVAIKVLEIDAVDFKVNLAERDQSYEDFLKELKTLQQIQSYGARNVNQIFEVMEVHSQLWIISEYCPGGSVHTLMQATRNRVEEKYLIPIARELAIGLDAVHKAYIIHRDVKAANVMIHEKGGVQIIDFGVAGSLVNETDKRMTVIGTPHWMGPEVFNPGETGYGKEVDTWAFGCTLYEMATGAPPRNRVAQGSLAKEFRLRGAPRLRPDQGYSQGLCDLIAFTLVINTKERPSMAQILEHPYLKGSESTYPTKSLKDFVREFQLWADAGGQRTSLLNPHGAEAATLEEKIIENPEWRFSTLEMTDFMDHLPASFDQHLPTGDSDHDAHIMSQHNQAADMTSTQAQEDAFNSYNASQPASPYLTESDITPGGSPQTYNMAAPLNEDASALAHDQDKVGRGKAQLGRIFDTEKSDYIYTGLNSNQSDLPLRNSAGASTPADSKGKVIDINAVGPSNSGSIALADPSTLKAKRKDRPNTIDWEFPTEATEDSAHEAQTLKNRPPTMSWDFPKDDAAEDTQSSIERPSTSQWNPPDGPPTGVQSEHQAPPPSGVSHESSGSWGMGSDNDYGAPSDDAYEDPYMTPYAPSMATYTPISDTPRTMDSDTGYHSHIDNPRQTLDLDAFGASYDLSHGIGSPDSTRQISPIESPGGSYNEDSEYGSAHKARQTLDLDALMNDMGPNLSTSTQSEAPATTSPSTDLNPNATLRDLPPSSDNHSATPPNIPTTANNTPTNGTNQQPQLPVPRPPLAAAMAHDAPPELLEQELLFQIEQWGNSLEFVREQYARVLAEWDDGEEEGEEGEDEGVDEGNGS